MTATGGLRDFNAVAVLGSTLQSLSRTGHAQKEVRLWLLDTGPDEVGGARSSMIGAVRVDCRRACKFAGICYGSSSLVQYLRHNTLSF